jgi:hypothetical protein
MIQAGKTVACVTPIKSRRAALVLFGDRHEFGAARVRRPELGIACLVGYPSVHCWLV